MEKSAAETVVSAPNGGGSSFGIKGSMVAMAIARRGTRPCDVCGLECAKWYCAADDAYLCERCDGSVHGANAVALRHERLKLGPNGVPMKNVRRILPLPSDLKSPKSSKDQRPESGSARHGWHHGTMRRPRSARPHPHANSVPKVKAEPGSPKLEDLFSDEFFACSKEFACGKEEQEVPIFVPLVPDHCFDLGFAKSEDSFSLEPPSTECLIRANTGLSVADECDLDRFLECDGDLCEMDSIMGNMEEFPSIVEMVAMDGKDMADDNYNMDFSEVEAFRSSNEPSDDSGDGGDDVDGPLHEFCGKVKMEEQELDKIKLEVDEMLGCAFSSVKDEEGQQKISLRLNYEDVMSAWSDRGPFWTEGPRPQTVPDVCNFDTMDMIVPDYGFYHMEQNGQVPVMHMGDEGYHRGREARVMRYREKRRTRLFSKKIRYEVRKLNAERRPRLKGRFVKRSLCS